MKKKIMVGAAAFAACALALAAKDAVVMTVNGVDVPKSEFEYLYHKNSQQQLNAQPIDEYAEMFKVYKLKVADALASGIDTLPQFKRDMDQYRRELTAPYLADSAYLLNLVQQAFDRSKVEAEFKHIMIAKVPDETANVASRQRLDSIRQLLLNGADFSKLALEFSQDRNVASTKGNLGYITTGLLPVSLEEQAFTLAEGEYSPVVDSPVGVHLIAGGKKRPARGQVLATHILKLVPKTAPEEEQARVKNQIDSIYNAVIADPASFERLATELSDDKGSARNGGQLPWFGAGRMVAPFDSAAFALAKGEISTPVRTDYGWHIVKVLDHRPSDSYEKVKADQLRMMESPQDSRYGRIRENLANKLAAKHKGKLNNSVIDELKAMTASAGIDSLYLATLKQAPLAGKTVASVGKSHITVGELAESFGTRSFADPARAEYQLDRQIRNLYYNRLVEAEQNWLEANNADYRNLMREYRDGSLLFEVSNQKVWDRAAKDKEGLEKFFAAHRNDYAWNEPHVKGILVQAKNDSVARLVKERLATLGGDTIVPTLRKEFAGEMTAEKVLVAKGANAMVDNLVFDGPKVNPAVASYTTYFIYEPRVLTVPEEVNDVRGLVTSDYQNELENEWVEGLKAKYPVVINEKVLKKIK